MSSAINFSKNIEFYTPKYILDIVCGDGEFDYDPATTIDKARDFGIKDYDTKETDGLKRDWTKFNKIWINPPFTLKKDFLQKAVYTYTLCKNEIYILLPISFMTTKSFHSIIGNLGYVLYLPDGRIKFESLDGESSSPAFGSVIIRLGGNNKEIKNISIQ